MVVYLQVNNLTKTFGDLILFRNISFGISEGQRIALIAQNGSGKTTLLNILSGKEDYDHGEIVFRQGIRVGYLEQDPQFPQEHTVLEACFHTGDETVRVIAEYEKAMASDDQEKLESLFLRMEQLQAWDYEHKIKQILTQLKITDFNQKIRELSGGQLKRVALANVLIQEPDLLILDEPTNHLDLEMTEWLEDYLKKNNRALLMVTHDRYFLDRVCNEILEIDNKQLYQYKGNYSYYLEKKQERMESQAAEMETAQNLYKKELEWMRRQPQARATKAKARKDAFYHLEDKVKTSFRNEQVNLGVQASYIGSKIFEAEHVYKSFGDLKILEDFNYTFSRYEKMGIIGNNGTGKSTFIKILLGEIQPDKGIIDIGETVRFGYYSQDGLQFDGQMKVIDVIRDIAEEISLGNGKKLSASQFLQHFLFTPETQYNYVYKLSGGEKRRLYLCSILIKNPNFLVLDEPTNDLDIVTLNVLEEYLKDFKGCVIVISHDRYFMDKVVDHLLVFKGNAEIKDFPGNYTDYRDWKEECEKEEKKSLSVKTENIDKNNSKPVREKANNKLTFKEKREFDSLGIEIEELEKEKRELEVSLNSGNLSSDVLIRTSTRMGEIMELIEEKTFRWLELSEKEG
ncbi:MAG: ABC-F family ATP-binding cassette domain-containing protein [Candidatus Azobacteroides sp.]|nr:ABC-F family ATP-binding cassette domain-containing protein [Candidatus Azobacteroides sp.]